MVRIILLILIITATRELLPAQLSPVLATCQSSCTGDLGENIFPDGNFGQGADNVLPINPGLAPGYTYQFNPPPDDGYYTITNNTLNWGSFAASTWIKIQDNGPEANGYMMVVNASYQPGIFYQKLVPVCDNTLYEMSVDVISMNTPSSAQGVIKPQLAFQINGVTVCETGDVPVDAFWHTYRFSFTTAPGQTQVTLAFRNNAAGGIGNDLAIDNITFRACGPDINLPATAKYCENGVVTLHASLADSPYPNPFFQWQYLPFGTGSWQNVPGLNQPELFVATPAEGDAYRLIVANSSGNLQQSFCRAVSQPVVLEPEDLSAFAIGGTDTILCNGAPALLEAGTFAQYHWSDNSNTPVFTAVSPGLYAVTVTSALGCTATDSLYVYEVELHALAEWMNPQCAGDSTGWVRLKDWTGGLGALQFGLNGSLLQQAPLFTRLPADHYEAFAIDSLGCDFLIPIDLEDPPALEIEFEQMNDISSGDTIQLQVTGNFPLTFYDWQPESLVSCRFCPAPFSAPNLSSMFYLNTVDERGCRASDSVFLKVLPLLEVYAPNVFVQDFSENGENNSFTLYPDKYGGTVVLLEVYNRWGKLVFRSAGQPAGAWNGLDARNRQQEQGVYVWHAVILFSDGTEKHYYGDVTLLRRGI